MRSCTLNNMVSFGQSGGDGDRVAGEPDGCGTAPCLLNTQHSEAMLSGGYRVNALSAYRGYRICINATADHTLP